MWPMKKKTKKGEIRRTQPVRTPGAMAKFKNSISPWTLLIAVMFVFATSVVVIMGGQVMPWQVGQRPSQDVRVRVSFQELDEQATTLLSEQARQSTPNYYEPNFLFLEQIDQDLNSFYTNMKAQPSVFADVPEAKKKTLASNWHVDENNYDSLRKFVSETTSESYQLLLKKFRGSLLAENLIEVRPEEYGKANRVILDDPKNKIRRQADQWFFGQDETKINAFLARTVKPLPDVLEGLVSGYMADHIKPIWKFNKAQTDKQRQARYESDENQQYQKYEAGSTLVRQDQRIGNRELQLLELEHKAYWKSLSMRDRLLSGAGTVMLIIAVTVSLWTYAYKYQPRAIHNWSRAFALAFSIFFMVLLARVLNLSGLNNYTATFEVVLLSVVMTIAYNQRFALLVVSVLVMLLMITLNTMDDSVSLLLTLLGAGTTVVLTLEEIRLRSKLIEIASAAGLMAFAVVWASQLASYQDIRFILGNSLFAAGGALVAGFVVQGLLPVIEKLFQIATSMTLLECCDVSKPLLRRLAIEAPGTYNHSLQIGSLSEAAAEAIGANGLLARVGAYYHDIGKIAKPTYFVENQPGNIVTRHKNLTPAMSFLVIIGHVKDGVEIAKEYGLPKVLLQFINAHHGTTLVEYFFNLASKQSEDQKKGDLDVAFRYPGPKPQSKECAILMLADGVEGATRSMAEPTAGRIESIVHQIVKKRLEDGQLDECEMSMRELHIVEESLVKSLCAIYHSRIVYPSTSETAKQTTEQNQETTTKVAKGDSK